MLHNVNVIAFGLVIPSAGDDVAAYREVPDCVFKADWQPPDSQQSVCFSTFIG